MKMVIQDLGSKNVVLAIFSSEIEASEWKTYCENLLLIDPSQGEISIIDAVENKNPGDFL